MAGCVASFHGGQSLKFALMGLRPRRVRLPLAGAGSSRGPSACAERVGTQEEPDVGAHYPACTFPCQRCTGSVTDARA